MGIITTTEVFDFMGTQTDVRTNQNSAIALLITREQKLLESLLRRKLTTQTATALALAAGKNCDIINDKVFLSGILRDTYSITALTEEGTALTESTVYGDDNDYIVDYSKGIICNLNNYWSTETFAIAITGKYGYVNSSDDSARDDMKQVLIEMVAARSGLWKKTFISPDGSVTVDKDEDEWLKSLISGHVNYGI